MDLVETEIRDDLDAATRHFMGALVPSTGRATATPDFGPVAITRAT